MKYSVMRYYMCMDMMCTVKNLKTGETRKLINNDIVCFLAGEIDPNFFNEDFDSDQYEVIDLDVNYPRPKALIDWVGTDIERLCEAYEQLETFDTPEELFFEVDDEDEECDATSWYPFDDEFFMIFESPMEAARAVYFGNIQSWGDSWIRLNGLGNCESTYSIDYDYDAEDIMRLWVEQHLA